MAKQSLQPARRERDYEVLVPSIDGETIVARVPIRVTVEWDPSIGEWLLTPESLERIENTKARHMGLLLPGELRALRERLRLTQRRIGDLLQIGGKTWTNWETGKQRPSRSANLVLRALRDGELSVEYLERARAPYPDWSRVIPFDPSRNVEPILMDDVLRDREPPNGESYQKVS